MADIIHFPNTVTTLDATAYQNATTLVFAAGIDPLAPEWSMSGEDLLVKHGTITLTLKHWFLDTTTKIGYVQFGDGAPMNLFVTRWYSFTGTDKSDYIVNLTGNNAIGEGGATS